MRLTRLFAGAAFLVAASAANMQAQSIIWYEDYTTSTWSDGMSALSVALPGATFYNASSNSDFFTQLNGGSYDLAVYGEESSSPTSGNLTDISNFLSGGGAWLGATWLTTTFMSIMDAGAVDVNNFSITDNGSPFYNAIWGTSPITLVNPTYGIFSQSYSAQNGAACVGSLGAGCAAIYGNGGKSILLGPLGDTYLDPLVGSDVVLNSSLLLLGAQSTVPEPVSMTLMATGLAGIAAARRRRKA